MDIVTGIYECFFYFSTLLYFSCCFVIVSLLNTKNRSDERDIPIENIIQMNYLEDGQIIDSILLSKNENPENGTIDAVVESRTQMRISYPLDSPEGIALLKGLKDEMVGERVIIANFGGKTHVGLKSVRGV